jgi:MFS family permease
LVINEFMSDRGALKQGLLTQSLAPLRRRAFRLLWIGQTVSSGGNALILVGLSFAILHIGGGAVDIGAVAAVQTIARLVFILIGGVWADRLRRHFVMLTADVLRAAVEAVLAVLLLTGHCRVWEIGVGAAIFGAATAFFGPASTGLVPETVPAEQLQHANSLISLSENSLQVVGPAVSGVLIVVFGPGLVFALDAVTFAVSAVSLGLLKLPPRVLPERTSFRSDLARGWHELTVRPWLWLNLCAHACYNLAVPAYLVLGPVIALRQLGGASAWGVITAAWGVGAVAGGFIGMRVAPVRPLVVANVGGVLGVLQLLSLAFFPTTWVICVASAVSGAGLIVLNIFFVATLQQLIPDETRSRVDSYDWLISLVAAPVGFALVGLIAEHIGDTATLTASAAILGIPCALVMLVPGVRNVRRSPKVTRNDATSAI